MDYTHTVFYIDEFGDEINLGDQTSLDEAKLVVKNWCEDCEDSHAKNSRHYRIRAFTGE